MAYATDFDTLAEHAEMIQAALPTAVGDAEITHGELTLSVSPQHIVEALTWLRDNGACKYGTLVDICGVDWPGRERRFEVVYHLLSMRQNQRLRLRAALREDQIMPSIVSVHPSADWFEREVYDMYGVMFSGHPDLRRILTDYGFRGYPMRKDFPLTGYVEVRYDETKKRVVYEPVKLVQEFRQFDFLSPWEGAHYVLPGDEKRGEG